MTTDIFRQLQYRVERVTDTLDDLHTTPHRDHSLMRLEQQVRLTLELIETAKKILGPDY